MLDKDEILSSVRRINHPQFCEINNNYPNNLDSNPQENITVGQLKILISDQIQSLYQFYNSINTQNPEDLNKECSKSLINDALKNIKKIKEAIETLELASQGEDSSTFLQNNTSEKENVVCSKKGNNDKKINYNNIPRKCFISGGNEEKAYNIISEMHNKGIKGKIIHNSNNP